MEVQGIICHGCGSSDVEFNPVTRKIHCNQCGREEYYSRAQLGATGKVAFEKDNAIHFFLAGKRDDARRFASDVLNMMRDNAAALFIMAYCEEFEESRSGAIDAFFRKTDGIALEYDEVRDLIKLFEASLYNMRDYEVEMVVLIVKNMQSDEDRPELEKFIDTISPYCIGRYTSSDFLDHDRTEYYCDLVSHCNLPKTCFALLKGIQMNPDSPYTANSFYMHAKTRYFLEHYVMSVGRILKVMKGSPVKSKFLSAYKAMVGKYKADAQALS